MIVFMTTPEHYRNWFSENTRTRVTAQMIADALGISRNAANSRMNKGLGADDLIAISRELKVNPVIALNELGGITTQEISDFLDSDGTLLATATPEQLLYQLADDLLPAETKLELGKQAMSRFTAPSEPEQPRSKTVTPMFPRDGIVTEWDDSVPYAADSSPDEDKLREERGEDLID